MVKREDIGVPAFERKVRTLLKQVERYATEGGDHMDAASNSKLELRFRRARDGLYDQQRYLSEEGQRQVEPLFASLRKVIAESGPRAAAARQLKRAGEIRELDQQARERRAWRIENGLEDPPKRY